ncbi:MAG TPA: hypothetical protein VHP11_07765, partial [Tepidisphaeraceae bacterium]|nr:hypothetical protein [Tepidisphaeraceae bacterium]
LLWGNDSPFRSFLAFSDWLYQRTGRTHAIALQTLAELVFEYLCEQRGRDRRTVAEALWRDYQRGGRRDVPTFLRPYLPEHTSIRGPSVNTLPRQSRHLSRVKGDGTDGQ